MNSIELRPTEKKDHYRLYINGVKWFLSSDEGFDQRFNKSRIQREILKNLSK